MRKEQLIEGVIEAARLIGSDSFVIIGSQAIHGTLTDPPIDAVIASIDVDLFPEDYRETMFVPMHAELGYDSEYFEKTGVYVEIVRPTLPRFPEGWRGRAHVETLHTRGRAGVPAKLNVIFPNLHDITVSKVIVGREQDLAFLHGVVQLGLVEQRMLVQGVATADRVSPEQRIAALRAVELAFEP